MRHSTNLARWRAATTGLVVALASCSLASCGGGPADSPATTPIAKDFYGIVPGVLEASDYARMKRANVGSLRVELQWAAIQPTRSGGFDWSGVDPIVSSAAAHGMSVLPILNGTPSFVEPSCPTCSATIRVHTPAQRAAWQRFLRAAVRRYGPGGSFWRENPGLPAEPMTRWQIWNEQNNPAYKDPPAVYAKFLGLTRQAIDAVDPKAQVVLGGMFGTPEGSRRSGVTAWSYLAHLLKDGAGSDFDAVALHPYSPTISGIRFQIEKIRGVLEKHQMGDIPILVTEIGWGSGGKANRHPGTGSRGQAFVVGPQRQARNLTAAYRLLTRNRETWHIEGVYWFTWKDPLDPPPGLCAFCYSSGLYRANGRTAKPALAAFEKFTRASARAGSKH